MAANALLEDPRAALGRMGNTSSQLDDDSDPRTLWRDRTKLASRTSAQRSSIIASQSAYPEHSPYERQADKKERKRKRAEPKGQPGSLLQHLEAERGAGTRAEESEGSEGDMELPAPGSSQKDRRAKRRRGGRLPALEDSPATTEAVDSNLAIDPNLKETEGTIHTAPPPELMAARSAKSDKVRPSGAETMGVVTDESGSYMLPPAAQFNGDGEAFSSPSRRAARPKGRGRGRPRKYPRPEDSDNEQPAVDNSGLGQFDDGSVEPTLDRDATSMPANWEKLQQYMLHGPGGNDDALDTQQPNDNGEPHHIEFDDLPTSGPFVKAEQRIVDDVVERFRVMQRKEQSEVNELIQNTNRQQTPATKELWNALYESLPHRTRVAVMRATRRRFHNYQSRGKWTPDEDEMLKQVYAQSPGKWVKIGAALERMPEDCRDRWRNYLSCGDERKTDDWNTKEEHELLKAVQECAEEVRKEAKDRAKQHGHAFREQDWNSQVNFNNVSAKMSHTRSRLQCYTHWKVMQNRDPDGGPTTKDETPKSSDPKKLTNRQGRALANYGKMTPADKYEILTQIVNSPAQDEDEIPWKALTRQDVEGKWSTRDRKEAFRMMKELIPDMPSFQDLLQALVYYFQTDFAGQLEQNRSDQGADFDTDEARRLLQAGINASPGMNKGKLKKRSTNARSLGSTRKRGSTKRKSLSAEHVSDSDDTDEAEDMNGLYSGYAPARQRGLQEIPESSDADASDRIIAGEENDVYSSE